MKQIREMSDIVLGSSDYVELFGSAEKTNEQTLKMVASKFRQMAKILHSDRFPRNIDSQLRLKAEAAFRRLTEFYNQAVKATQSDDYGNNQALAVISTKKARHEILRTAGRGDIAATYAGKTFISGTVQEVFIKIAKNFNDNDLIASEIEALKLIHSSSDDVSYGMFVPTLVDSFSLKDGALRKAIVTPLLEGFYSLTEVRNSYASGVPVLDVVWIWRRLLMALGFTHDQGVIHGAVLPQNVMIHPEFHGLILVDWCCCSIKKDGKYSPIKVIVADNKDWYPQEVVDKTQPSEATDIMLAARTMIFLLGGNLVTGALPDSIPRPIRAFLKGCLIKKQIMRPYNAWLLLKEFDELLEEMGAPYYPRRFHEFTMPIGVV